MTTKSIVSVLMTNYNSERFIEETIKSVLSQSFQDFEFVIVDDCSSDSSYGYLKKIQDSRLSIYQNKQNLGQTKSLNIGLKLAQGEFVARMDADDLAFPHWLQEQVNFIQKHPACAVVSAQAAVVDAHSRLQKIYYSPQNMNEIIIRSLTESPINHVGSIMRRDTILSVGGYDENYKIAADYDLWGKLIRGGYAMTSNPKILVGVRVHGYSVSQLERRKADIVEIRRIMKKNIDQFVSAPITEEQVQLLSCLFFDEGALNFDEFKQAIDIFDRICRQIKPVVAGSLAVKWQHKESQVAFLKRIYLEIHQENFQSVRKVSVLGIKRFGLASPFLAFYLLSLGGNFILAKASLLYEGFLKLKTFLKIRRLRLV